MSKLSVIRKSLEENPVIRITKVFEGTYLPGRNKNGVSHAIDFWVTPKNELVGVSKYHGDCNSVKYDFDWDELEKVRVGLVPAELQPSDRIYLTRYNNHSGLRLDRLYFDENVGYENITRQCILTDEELLNTSGFIDGKKTIEEVMPYTRGIWISLFPNEVIVNDVLRNIGIPMYGVFESFNRWLSEELYRNESGKS